MIISGIALYTNKLICLVTLLLVNFNCLPFDYIARQKLGETNLELHDIKQFLVLPSNAYSSKTFRVFKKKEIAEYGEYRTQRLVLEVWDNEERR